ncbi:MAG: hypothetical protein DWP97_06650 [Calditrichaeota bacterium]|nr:MAG: hypothetical protein DWP97_06650 [Calditrichota bacterium]
MRKTAVQLLFLLLPALQVWGLTQPNISVIGDFRSFTGDYKDDEGNDLLKSNNWNSQLNSLELAFNGNLNPYTRADIYIANHGEGFETEEAYVTFLRGLPFKMQLKAGQYLVDFGRLNTVHPHAYSFLDRPLSHRVFFGYDGFKDKGIQASFLLPTSFYSKLSLNLLAGDLFEPHSHGHEEEEVIIDTAMMEEEHGHSERGTKNPIFSSRLSFFFPIGESGNVDFGLSGLYGVYQRHEEENLDLKAQMGAIDMKFKHKPSDYSALTLQSEMIFAKHDIEDEVTEEVTDISTSGFWASIDYQFRKQYNIGFKYDYAPGIFDYTEEVDYGFIPHEEENMTGYAKFDESNFTQSFTLFAGYMIMEETTLIRAAYTKTMYDISESLGIDRSDHYTFALQVVWSLGPHKPHDF